MTCPQNSGSLFRQKDIKVIKEEHPARESLKHNVLTGAIVSFVPLPEYCLAGFKINQSPREYDKEQTLPVRRG